MVAAGDPAPPFELTDLGGTRHSLSEALASGPALVVFWKPDCATCHLAFPYLQRLLEAYPQPGWTLFGVSQDSAERSAPFAKRYGLSFPVLIDRDGWVASRRYDPEATPTLYLVSRGSRVLLTSVGFSKEDVNEISGQIAGALDVAPVLVARDDDGKPPFKPG
jgi:peroxiredoxin